MLGPNASRRNRKTQESAARCFDPADRSRREVGSASAAEVSFDLIWLAALAGCGTLLMHGLFF
jgi:hypothetical protein